MAKTITKNITPPSKVLNKISKVVKKVSEPPKQLKQIKKIAKKIAKKVTKVAEKVVDKNPIKDIQDALKKVTTDLNKYKNISAELPVLKSQLKHVQNELARSKNNAAQIPGLKKNIQINTSLKNRAQFDYKNLKKSIVNLNTNQENTLKSMKITHKSMVSNLQDVLTAENTRLKDVIKKKNLSIKLKSNVAEDMV